MWSSKAVGQQNGSESGDQLMLCFSTSAIAACRNFTKYGLTSVLVTSPIAFWLLMPTSLTAQRHPKWSEG